MASLNPLTREVVFKIVFYGPGLGGKTTTLQYIHANSKPEHRGKMVSLATPMDRTLYFDFLPLRVPLLHGMHVRLQLFTVPGQVYFGATRKLVLTGADGVVFVADSQLARHDANLEALEDLVMNLADNNLALLEMPHTFHYNKRDIPDVVPIADLDKVLNPQGAPSLGTVATSGEGVFPGLERITRLVLAAYESELPRSSEKPEKSDASVVSGAAISSNSGASAGPAPTSNGPAGSDRSSGDRPAIEENTIADALRGLAEAPTRTSSPGDGPQKIPSSSRNPVSGGTVSSLESIPNPIPRRATGSFDAASAVSSTPQPSSATSGVIARSTPSSRGPVTPPPGTEVSASGHGRPQTPAPPRSPSSPGIVVPAVAPAASAPHHRLPPTSGTTVTPSERPMPQPREDGKRRVTVEESFATNPPPSMPTSAATSTAAREGEAGISFALLWAEPERESARQAEAALAAGEAAAALLVCDVLVTRLLASAAGLTGNVDAPRDPGLVVLLLGLDGKRYLAFRASVRAARAHEATSPTDALEGYVFALEVRHALSAIGW